MPAAASPFIHIVLNTWESHLFLDLSKPLNGELYLSQERQARLKNVSRSFLNGLAAYVVLIFIFVQFRENKIIPLQLELYELHS